tara:strand:- start:2484 stop:2708 length:225 start_codon:yes stop_codon:yes gene_type:complete
MSDDLVKRLRAIDKDIILRRFDPEMSFDGMTAHEAADRIERLEAALRTVKEWHGYRLLPETTRMIDAALEGKDD